MANNLIHAMLFDEISIYACDISNMVEGARKIHNTSPIATILLGRTMAATTMMSAMLKNDSDVLTVSLNGGGPAGTVMATAKANLLVKAYIANPSVDVEPVGDGGFNIKDALGHDGFVTVIKDLGLKDAYIGKTPIISGEVGEDIAKYFLDSEQQPSIVYVNTWLETDMSVINAGGIIIKPLPGCSEETLVAIEEKISQISNFAMYQFTSSTKEVLEKLFSDMELSILETREPAWYCDCNKERLERVIISLGKDEITDIINEDQGAHITCRFCNKEYNFTVKELERLLTEAQK